MYNYKEFIEQWITQGDNWARLIPYKGTPIYPADLNTIQSILNNQVGSILDSIYKNGSIVTGVDILVRDTICEVTTGLFYLDGMLISIPNTQFNIDKLQNYTLYLHIDETTSRIDQSVISKSSQRDLLLVPSQGTQVVSISAHIELNNPSQYILGSITLGIPTTNKSNYTSLTHLLAVNNYERYGNFIVKGLQPNVLNTNTSYSGNTQIPISVIDAGRLYIRNLEDALRDSIQAQTLIGNQMYITINNFNNTGDNTTANNLQLLRTSFDSASKNVDFFRTQLRAAYSNLSINSSSISKYVKDTINISPGVAYIEGYRVAIPTSTSIDIERDLTEQLIENAKYEINEVDFKIYRSLNLSDEYTFDDLLTYYSEIYITVENLIIGGKQGTGRVVCVINNNLPDYVTSIQVLLDFLIAEIAFTPYNHMNIRFESVQGNISSGVNIRDAISKALQLDRITSNTISFTPNENTLTSITTTTNSSLITWDKDKSYLGSNITSNNYVLSFTPVTRIKSLIADMQRKNEPIIRSNSDRDILPDDTIFDIDSITQGNIKYLPGIDYELLGTNTIRWLFKTVPSNGTLYYVTYKYTQPLLENEDFILSKIDNSITFVNKVPNGKSFIVDYFYSLNKKGYIYLNSNGEFRTQVYNLNEEAIPTPLVSSILLCTFEITPLGIQLLPTNINKVITPELVTILEERIRMLEEDTYSLMTQYSNNLTGDIASNHINNFIDIEPQLEDSYTYNVMLGGITPSVKAVTYPLIYTNGAELIRDNLFSNDSLYVSLPKASSITWDITGLSEDKYIYLSPVLNTIKQPITLTSVDRISKIDPFESKLSLLDTYTFTLIKDTYKLGSSIYLDSMFKDITRQLGKFLTTIRDSIEYGSFNTLSLPSSYFFNSFIQDIKVTGCLLKVVVVNLPSRATSISIHLNNVSVNDRTIPLGNTSKDINNLLTADINGYLTFELQLPPLTLGTHIIEIIRSNEVIVSKVLVFPPDVLISGTNQAFTSWNQAIPNEVTINHPINSRSVSSFLTLSLGNSVPLNQDSLVASDESLIQYFTPISDVVIEGLCLHVRAFDSKVRIVGVLKEAIIDSEYQFDSYRTTENVIGLLTNSEIVDGNLPTKLILTTPTPLYKGHVYALCLYIYNSWIELSSYESQYPLPYILLKGGLYRSGYDSFTFSPSRNIHLDLMLLTFTKDLQQDVYLGTYNLEEGVNTTHFCLNTYPILPSGTSLHFQYYDGVTWRAYSPNNIIPLSSAISTLQLRVVYKTNDINTTPLISLSESSITLFTSSSSLVYTSESISINQTYNQIDILMEYLNDPSITYELEIGQDSTNTWYTLNPVPDSLINLDSSGLFKQIKYIYSNQLDNTLINNYAYRITATTSDSTRIPCIRKVSTYVHS